MEVEDVGEAADDPVLYIIGAASFVLAFWATVAFLFCLPFGQCDASTIAHHNR
jgi:hypothetical protein